MPIAERMELNFSYTPIMQFNPAVKRKLKKKTKAPTITGCKHCILILIK